MLGNFISTWKRNRLIKAYEEGFNAAAGSVLRGGSACDWYQCSDGRFSQTSRDIQFDRGVRDALDRLHRLGVIIHHYWNCSDDA